MAIRYQEKMQPLGNVEIADIVFGLHSNYPKPILWIQDAYPMFLSRRNPTIQLFIRYQKRWPKGLPMRVSDEPKVEWSGNNFLIQTAYYRARGSFTEGKVEATIAPGFSGSGLLRTLLSLFLIREGGLLLHAAGLVEGKRAHVFCGPTGSGKTTIATKLANGHTILTDETLAVRRMKSGYQAYSTPFPGDMNKVFVNQGARMESLFLIHHGERFFRRSLSSSEVVPRIFPQIIGLERNLEGVEAAFKAVTVFSRKIPCYDLSFQPTMELWSHLS